MTPVESVLLTIVRGIVRNPTSVSLLRTENERGILLTVTVNPLDMGIIIGKEGAMIERIRLIMKAVGLNHKAFVAVQVTDPRAQTA